MNQNQLVSCSSQIYGMDIFPQIHYHTHNHNEITHISSKAVKQQRNSPQSIIVKSHPNSNYAILRS